MHEPAGLPNVRKANRWLTALWRSGLAPRPRLELDALEATALRGQSQTAFGSGESWREPLNVLVQSLREEADLNPLGLTLAHGQIVLMLRARIRAATLGQAHPEILARPIPAPVIILGQMRSGTTRLQRLLACDDRLAFTRFSETFIPVPYARRPGSDSRRFLARAALALRHWLNSESRRIHPTHPTAPEEEFGLISFGFGSAQYEAQWRVPEFTRWWETADKRALYREFRALLQTNAWFRGDPPGRPPILKLPQFLEDLPAVLDTFPDARLICLDRHLDQVVASSASLVWNEMRVQSDRTDRGWIGREWLRKTRRRDAALNDVLAARPHVPRVHVAYDAMSGDWRTEMGRIFTFLGMELEERTVGRMAAYLGGAKAHLGHRYSLDQFGLSRVDADKAVAGAAVCVEPHTC